jgi:hypothetical protein
MLIYICQRFTPPLLCRPIYLFLNKNWRVQNLHPKKLSETHNNIGSTVETHHHPAKKRGGISQSVSHIPPLVAPWLMLPNYWAGCFFQRLTTLHHSHQIRQRALPMFTHTGMAYPHWFARCVRRLWPKLLCGCLFPRAHPCSGFGAL